MNRARWDLCGGRSAMGVPTAIRVGQNSSGANTLMSDFGSRPACATGAMGQLLCGPTDDEISRLQIETALSHAGFHTTTDVSGDVWMQIVGTTH